MEPSVEFSWIFCFRLPGGGDQSVEMGRDVMSSLPRWVHWVMAATAAPAQLHLRAWPLPVPTLSSTLG